MRTLFGFVAGCCLTLCFVGPASAAELCLAPSALAGNVTLDCSVPPTAFPNEWIGFNTEGSSCGTHLGTFPCLVVPGSEYGWSISSSDTDPAQVFGPLGAPFPVLYLWLVCGGTEGMSAAAFDLEGDLLVLGFTPRNGFVNTGTPTELLLSVGACPIGPVIAGEILVFNPALHVDPGVEASPWGRVKARHR